MRRLEPLTLGGVTQWIMLRGQPTSPLLLFLHGGPGSAEIGVAAHYQRRWERHFLVVNWDQHGAGKSCAAGVPLSLNTLVTDTAELSQYLLERFEQPHLTLVGHSWGGTLALLVGARNPELFNKVVVVAPNVHGAENERLSYAHTLERARATQNRLALAHLTRLGSPPYSSADKLLQQRAWLTWFGGFFRSRRDALRYALRLVTSPDYTPVDKLNYLRGSGRSLQALAPEVESLNLFEAVPRLEVPALFCLGRHDYTTPSSLAEHYYNELNAPEKHLVWFERSAHFPHLEEGERFLEGLEPLK